MNPVTVLIGVAAILFGLYTLYIRATDPSKFEKLEAMKKQWGEKAGTVMHVVGYSVMPIVFGIIMLIAGLKGASPF